jgi:hypothetical protein
MPWSRSVAFNTIHPRSDMDSEQYKLLLLDYSKAPAAVDKFDDFLFRIKNWSIVSCGAVTAYGYDKMSCAVLFLGFLLAGMCGLLAHLYKSMQFDVMNRVYHLEEVLYPAADVTKLPRDYQFGIGHAFKGATMANLWKALRHSKLWYMHIFYAALAAIPLLAMLHLMIRRT